VEPDPARARRVLAEADCLVQDVISGPARLGIGYAWSALGRHTLAFGRLRREHHPEADLVWPPTSPGGGTTTTRAVVQLLVSLYGQYGRRNC
jgi:hypothetical protein